MISYQNRRFDLKLFSTYCYFIQKDLYLKNLSRIYYKISYVQEVVENLRNITLMALNNVSQINHITVYEKIVKNTKNVIKKLGFSNGDVLM